MKTFTNYINENQINEALQNSDIYSTLLDKTKRDQKSIKYITRELITIFEHTKWVISSIKLDDKNNILEIKYNHDSLDNEKRIVVEKLNKAFKTMGSNKFVIETGLKAIVCKIPIYAYD